MKIFTTVTFCLLFASTVFAQQSQLSFAGDISGVCDATTIDITQNAGIGWDDCVGGVYTGTVEFEAIPDTNLYNVYTVSPDSVQFNDMSFGAYYPCYMTDSQEGMPNADLDLLTLFFQVSENGDLGFSGASQWGEIYSLFDVTMDSTQLNFQWTNDYGEGAAVELVRQDGQLWKNLLAGTVATHEISQIESISINPNPISSGQNILVSIDLNQSIDMNLQIIDIAGKIVYNQLVKLTEGKNEINIDSQFLNGGMYFLKLSSENGVTTKKIVIQ